NHEPVVPTQTDSSPLVSETSFELGLWLSGIESFLETGDRTFADRSQRLDADVDRKRSFRLLHSGLLLCSEHCLRLQKMNGVDPKFVSEVYELSLALRDLIVIGDRLSTGPELKFADWKAWKDNVITKFNSQPAFRKLIGLAERS